MQCYPSETDELDMVGRRIRCLLEKRYAVYIGEICQRLGLDERVVRAELQTLMASGEVDRLRPLGCEREDNDFFRLRGVESSLTIPQKRQWRFDRRGGRVSLRSVWQPVTSLWTLRIGNRRES